jgi:putative transposase
VKYAWIKNHSGAYPVARMCRVLSVSRSGFIQWADRRTSKRQAANEALAVQVKLIHARHIQRYGRPRIWRELTDAGQRVGHERLRRLMLEHGIRSVHRRKFRHTTDSKHLLPVAANLLGQRFEAPAPDRIWLADATYIATTEGWLYLAAVLDLCTRRIVGWSMSAHLNAKLVCDALAMACGRRQPKPGLIHHSDRGIQYASELFRMHLKRYGIIQSMSRCGNAYDNAPMESFFHTLKVECTHRRRYQSRDQARRDVIEFIEGFYNPVRRHSALQYLSPMNFERSLYS